MKGKNSDRALVHLDGSIYFYLKWGWKWAIAGCKAELGTPGIPPVSDMTCSSDSQATHNQSNKPKKLEIMQTLLK